MTWWTLTPRDPLLVRDGRPFGVEHSARSLDFPFPSVMAGTFRSRVGFAAGGGRRFGLTPDEARAIPVWGPLLVRVRAEGCEALFPAPADCLFFEAEAAASSPAAHVERFALTPHQPPAGILGCTGLLPFHGQLPSRKPDRAPPRFWALKVFQDWLDHPADSSMSRNEGLTGLVREARIHVAMREGERTAEDGKLFATEGLRFVTATDDGPRDQLALAIRCDDSRLAQGVTSCGGERRLALVEDAGTLPLPRPPAPARRYRVVLLTPALFAAGSEPDTIHGAAVRCAAVGRHQAISGWDLAARGPKPSRRMAPAGSVYWVELAPDQDPQAWVDAVHLACVSDEPQDCLDGFGLAVVGTWREPCES